MTVDLALDTRLHRSHEPALDKNVPAAAMTGPSVRKSERLANNLC